MEEQVVVAVVDKMTSIDIGVMVVAVGYVFDKFWGLLKAKGVDLKKMADQIQILTDQHSVRDQDGVLVWYMKKSYGDTLISIGKSLNGIHNLLDRMTAIEEDRAKRK